MIKNDSAYPVKLWREALEAADVAEFCPIDTREHNGGELGALGAWLCDDLYGSDEAGSAHGESNGVHVTEQIIDGALAVMTDLDTDTLTPDHLIRIVRSYRGESVADFEELARDYAETDYIGPEDENPDLTGWEGFDSPEKFEKWYTDHATSEGEVAGEIREGGTLIWFDSHQW